MQPVEINAGVWYLRALRADQLMDDRPALRDLGITDTGYVDRCTADWEHDVRYTWAVCEPTTGEMLAEIALSPTTGIVSGQARPGFAEAARVATDTVRRFASANRIGLSS